MDRNLAAVLALTLYVKTEASQCKITHMLTYTGKGLGFDSYSYENDLQK